MSDFSNFIDLVVRLKSRKDIEDFLVGITTDNERREFAQRIEIVKQLLAGIPQKQIAKQLGVGIGTVTRGSKEIKAGRFKYMSKDVLDK